MAGRFGRLPLYASLEYSVMSQNNNPDVGTPATDLFRQVVMLNLTGLVHVRARDAADHGRADVTALGRAE